MSVIPANSSMFFMGGTVMGPTFEPPTPDSPFKAPVAVPVAPVPGPALIVRLLATAAGASVITGAVSKVIAEPLPDVEEVAEAIRRAMEEAIQKAKRGKGGTTTPPPPKGPGKVGGRRRPSIKPFIGPAIAGTTLIPKIATELMTEAQEQPEPERRRRTRRRPREKTMSAWFERRYSARKGSKNRWMFIRRNLE